MMELMNVSLVLRSAVLYLIEVESTIGEAFEFASVALLNGRRRRSSGGDILSVRDDEKERCA